MTSSAREAIVDRLRPYDRLVEVGIGSQPAIAAILAAEAVVTATDVHPREVPDTVRFVKDDVTEPKQAVYEGADMVYALNLPPELHRSVVRVARIVEADCVFTTLGGDAPAVSVRPESIPGDTLFWARGTPSDSGD